MIRACEGRGTYNVSVEETKNAEREPIPNGSVNPFGYRRRERRKRSDLPLPHRSPPHAEFPTCADRSGVRTGSYAFIYSCNDLYGY